MRHVMTREGQLCGYEPLEVDAEVDSYDDIDKPGIYFVKGVDAPVCVSNVTPYGAACLSENGTHIQNGMSFTPTGWFVD